MGRNPGALSAELLCQGARRADRRSQQRLEGPWVVDDKRRPHTVAEGGRQGHGADRLPLPAAPEPTSRLTRSKARAASAARRRHSLPKPMMLLTPKWKNVLTYAGNCVDQPSYSPQPVDFLRA